MIAWLGRSAPRLCPSLKPPYKATLTAGANSGLDKTWGQRHDAPLFEDFPVLGLLISSTFA
jgi:hypothetical protein